MSNDFREKRRRLVLGCQTEIARLSEASASVGHRLPLGDCQAVGCELRNTLYLAQRVGPLETEMFGRLLSVYERQRAEVSRLVGLARGMRCSGVDSGAKAVAS